MRSKMQSIRLSEEEYSVIRNIAKTKNMKVSTFIRDCFFAYLHNMTEHEKLLEALKPEDPKEFQKTFFDVLNNSNDAVLKSLEKIQIDISKKSYLLDKLQRQSIFLHFLFNREIFEEDIEKVENSANRRTKEFLEDFEKSIKRGDAL